MRGGLIHGIVDRELPNTSRETRLYKEIGGYVLSGQIDCYRHDTQTLEDYKTLGDKGIFVLLKDGVPQKHIWQLQVYKWLMDGGRVGGMDGEQVFWHPKKMVIHSMTMMTAVTSGQMFAYEFYEQRDPKPYRYEVRREYIKRYAGGGVKVRIFGKTPDVPVYTNEHVEEYLIESLNSVAPGLQDPTIDVDGVMFDEKNNYLCSGYCDVQSICESRYAAAGDVRYLDRVAKLEEIKNAPPPAKQPRSRSQVAKPKKKKDVAAKNSQSM